MMFGFVLLPLLLFTGSQQFANMKGMERTIYLGWKDPFWKLRTRMTMKIRPIVKIQTKRMIFKKLPTGERMVKI
ncbi:hypothetical protein AAHA92_26592 [Salvia divinorum]|uniref:Secreted protein n=1 Tax=Salvia divinorum TaxID=28513 RepID=A0ABD1GEY9_SALDI